MNPKAVWPPCNAIIFPLLQFFLAICHPSIFSESFGLSLMQCGLVTALSFCFCFCVFLHLKRSCWVSCCFQLFLLTLKCADYSVVAESTSVMSNLPRKNSSGVKLRAQFECSKVVQRSPLCLIKQVRWVSHMHTGDINNNPINHSMQSSSGRYSQYFASKLNKDFDSPGSANAG